MINFKIRCSAISKIMGKLKNQLTDKQLQTMSELKLRHDQAINGIAKPLTKNQAAELSGLEARRDIKMTHEALPEGAKTYCKDWFKEQLYGKRQEIKSKYLEKGILGEDDAISLVIETEQLGWNEKNEQSFENDFMTGTPDLIYPKKLVTDTKVSFDCFTFPLFVTETDKSYWWQLQGYMKLTVIDKAMLAYCLVDMPASMIEKESWQIHNKAGGDIEEIYNQVLEKRTYSHIDKKHRVKTFRFDYDDAAITSVERRVALCRDYIEVLKKELGVA